MQFCTEQMVQDIIIVENRLKKIAQQSECATTKILDKYFILITDEDDKNLTSDLVKLDRYLYWTDLKGSLLMRNHHYANIPHIIH